MSTRHKYLRVSWIVAVLIGGVIGVVKVSSEHQITEKTSKHLKVIRAEHFELVDENGKSHAELSIAGGSPRFSLWDSDGHSINLSFTKGGPVLQKNGKPVLLKGQPLQSQGGPQLAINGSDGSGAFLGLLGDNPTLVLFGKHFNTKVSIQAGDELSSLMLWNKKGMEVDLNNTGLGIHSHDAGGLQVTKSDGSTETVQVSVLILDKDNNIIWHAPKSE